MSPYRDVHTHDVSVRWWNRLIHRTLTVAAVSFGVLYSAALLASAIPLAAMCVVLFAIFVFFAPWAEALGINDAIHAIRKESRRT